MEIDLLDLWAPILAAWLSVHVLSTVAWMVSPHHKRDWAGLRMDAGLADQLRHAGAEPGGQYLLQTGDADQPDPAACSGTLTLWSHTPSMGANVGLTLGFFLLAAVVIAYLATIGLDRESSSADVFRFTATAALLTHAAPGIPGIIWFRRRFVMDVVDGAVFALATGVAFTALWPR